MNARVDLPRPADAVATMLPGSELGRVVNHELAVKRFGPERVREMTDAFVRGDDVGYLAWKSLRDVEGPRGAGRAMLNKAIAEGIDSVENPPPALAALIAEIDDVPSWVDFDQLRRGAVAYWRAGRLVPAALVYQGYGAGLRYGGTRPTLFSRRLQDQASAGTRMRETVRWVVAATTPGSMGRFEDGLKLTLHVRMIHASVRDFITKSPHWQWDEWGLPINSADGLYQAGGLFCAAVIDGVEKLGVTFSRQEREDMFALWRYLGHVMGVPADLNYTDEADMRAKMEVSELLERAPDEDCTIMMHAMIDYVCEEFTDYHILPAVIDTRLSVQQKKSLTYGVCRALLGDTLCDGFSIPQSRVASLVPLARRAINVKESIARRLPHDDAAAAWSTIKSLNAVLSQDPAEPPVVDTDVLRAQLEANHGKSAELT